MIDTWKWTKNDSALATLPLNHFSGLVYCLLTPFYLKAQVELMPKFNAEYVWSQLLSEKSNINLFIGVPTVFNQLIDVYLKKVKQNYDEEMVKMILNKKMRIIGSGSAALNIKTYNEWFELTNYKLLERYGMTEIGMALSNPYRESNLFKREAGCVGRPCTNCKVRIVNNEGNVLIESDETTDNIYSDSDDIFGELQINGPILFKEYFNKTEQTNLSFTPDGWFKTG
jgi:malonyl-CoA/methylmalonyl-CoA synthetase